VGLPGVFDIDLGTVDARYDKARRGRSPDLFRRAEIEASYNRLPYDGCQQPLASAMPGRFVVSRRKAKLNDSARFGNRRGITEALSLPCRALALPILTNVNRTWSLFGIWRFQGPRIQMATIYPLFCRKDQSSLGIFRGQRKVADTSNGDSRLFCESHDVAIIRIVTDAPCHRHRQPYGSQSPPHRCIEQHNHHCAASGP